LVMRGRKESDENERMRDEEREREERGERGDGDFRLRTPRCRAS
jgi:hypothetical protein